MREKQEVTILFAGNECKGLDSTLPKENGGSRNEGDWAAASNGSDERFDGVSSLYIGEKRFNFGNGAADDHTDVGADLSIDEGNKRLDADTVVTNGTERTLYETFLKILNILVNKKFFPLR